MERREEGGGYFFFFLDEEPREREPLLDFLELLDEELDEELRVLPDWRERLEEFEEVEVRLPDCRLLDDELLPPDH